MPTNIRESVFETNSSSTHTVVLRNDIAYHYNEYLCFPVDLNEDKILIHIRTYGWEHDWLCFPIEKVAYLISYAAENCMHELWRDEQFHAKYIEPIEDWDQKEQFILGEINRRLNDIPNDSDSQCWKDLYELIDLVKQYNDCKAPEVKLECDRYGYGVDHQSNYGTIEKFLSFNNVDSLRDFIFNDQYWLRISNDNEEDYELDEVLGRPHDYEDY